MDYSQKIMTTETQQIYLSKSAAQKIRALMTENADFPQNIRFYIEKGGCSGFEYGMQFDDPVDQDNRFESNGVSIVVDPFSLQYLKGMKVEFDDGLNGKGFYFENPNANHNCGCGKSFH